MGIKKRPNGSWRVRVYDDSGKEHARHFDRRIDAERFESEYKAARQRGQWVDPNDKTTVAQWAYRWAEARPHRESTARNTRSLIKHHIEATPLGTRKLNRVRPSDVQSWATERSKHMSPLRLRNLVSMVRAMMADAVLDHLIGINPAARVKIPTVDQPRIVPLTDDQVWTLAETVPARNYAMVVTQAGCGLRIGELLALTVADVDFLRRTLRVRYQFAPNSKVRTDPKTPRSKRSIPLPTIVADSLAAHIAKFPPTEDGTLFSTRQATPYRHDYYGSQLFKRAVLKAGLPATTTTHDLRHYYASVLLANGVDVVTVADRLGHTNGTTVLKIYGHLIAGREDLTRKAIDETLGNRTRTHPGQRDAPTA